MLLVARKALAFAHNKAVHLTTRELHCLSSILVSPPLVSLYLPESWALDTDSPSSVLFGNSLPSCRGGPTLEEGVSSNTGIVVVTAIAMDWIPKLLWNSSLSKLIVAFLRLFLFHRRRYIRIFTAMDIFV